MSAGFNIGGLVSGIDTNSLIRELLRVERIPIRSMEQNQNQLRAKIDAFSEITTRLSALRDATNGLRELSDFAAFRSVTSSNESAVTASVNGSPNAGSVSFTVDQLATQHQVRTGSFTSTTATTGAGTVSFTVDGTQHDITTSSTTTISDLASSINNLGAGISAQVLKVADSDYRLVVTSSDTGASAAFTTASTAANVAFTNQQTAQDAQLTFGSGVDALTVSRSSNTVTDVIDGVTLNLKSVSATAVTISTARDTDAAVEAVKGFVEALNATLNTIDEKTAYDVENNKGSALSGDSTARQLRDALSSAISRPVASLSGTYSFASQVGLEIQSDGTFQLNESKLRTALTSDFDGVADLFARAASSTDSRVSFSNATDATQPGSYLVQITQAARVAAVTGTVAASPPTDPQQYIFTTPEGETITVSVPANSDATAVVNAINSALVAANINSLSARVTVAGESPNPGNQNGTPGEFVIESTDYGSGTSFTVAADTANGFTDVYGMAGTYSGTDVQGTINGEAAEGSGRSLKSTSGDSEGLRLTVSATQSEVDAAGGTLSLGSTSYSEGIAGTLSRLLENYEGSSGLIAQRTSTFQSGIDLYQDRIDAFELRLESREVTLRRQFTAMESAIASLQQQSSFLFAQLGQAPQQ